MNFIIVFLVAVIPITIAIIPITIIINFENFFWNFIDYEIIKMKS